MVLVDDDEKTHKSGRTVGKEEKSVGNESDVKTGVSLHRRLM